MIMSLIFPDAGQISILGHKSALQAKDRIGYLPEERGVYRQMRASDFIVYIARLKGVRDPNLKKRVCQSMESIGLEGAARNRCEELSKGMLQKVQFLAATIHKPDLLILDEPFSGLDPVSTRQLRSLILEEHRLGATILYSTHLMAQAEDICERVIMMHKGCKVLDERVSTIRNQYDPRSIQVELLDPKGDPSAIRWLPEIETILKTETGYEVRLTERADVQTVMRQIPLAVPVARLELSRPRLEDVFLRIVATETARPTQSSDRREGTPPVATKAATA